MAMARITSKGQVTIPRSVRDRLKLKPGDRVDFAFEGGNRVVLRPAKADIRELKGALHRPGRRATVEEMNEAIRRRGAG